MKRLLLLKYIKLNNCLKIFLDNVNLRREVPLAMDNVKYLLQGFEFFINRGKSILQTCQILQFLDGGKNFKGLIISIYQEKKKNVTAKYHILLGKALNTIRELN